MFKKSKSLYRPLDQFSAEQRVNNINTHNREVNITELNNTDQSDAYDYTVAASKKVSEALP